MSASVAAAAQTQLAQLIADHGGHILQVIKKELFGPCTKESQVVLLHF